MKQLAPTYDLPTAARKCELCGRLVKVTWTVTVGAAGLGVGRAFCISCTLNAERVGAEVDRSGGHVIEASQRFLQVTA